MKREIVKYIKAFLCAQIIIIFIGCEVMTFQEEEMSTPNESLLNLKYDFSGVSNPYKIDSVYLFASRLYGLKHSCFVTTREGAFVKESCKVDTMKGEFNLEDSISSGGDYLRCALASGNYSMLAVTQSKNYTTIINKDTYVFEPSSVGLKDLSLNYVTMADVSDSLLSGSSYGYFMSDQADCYLINNFGPIYFSTINRLFIPSNSLVMPQFKFEKLTQTINLNFNFKFKSSSKYSIVEGEPFIYAELTGVASSMKIVQSELDLRSLNKMVLTNKGVSMDEKGLYTYRGSIEALGLLGGPDFLKSSGPGVLRIGIKLLLNDKHTKVTTLKTIFATQNISEEIKYSPLTFNIGDDPFKRKQGDKSVSIFVKKDLVIDIDALVAGNKYDSGWLDVSVNCK